MQFCPGCERVLLPEAFSPYYRGKNGERCRECHSKMWKERSPEQKAKAKRSTLAWVKKNQDKVTQNNREWRNHNLGRHFIHTSSQRAKRIDVPYSLTHEDLTPFPTICGYCGVGLAIRYGKRGPSSPSLDRIIPSLGYTKQNVVVCCWQCNRLKCDMTPPQLTALAIRVSEVAKQRGIK